MNKNLLKNPQQENSFALKIGNVKVNSKLSLAPMAGITDMPLRQLIRKFSKNCLLTTEMISSEMLMQNRKDGNDILEYQDNELPLAFQLSGHKPDLMTKAAKKIADRASIIDVNMGCPVKKVVGGGDGSYLMKTPQIASDIVKSLKDNFDIPITVKFRLGYTSDEKNFLEFARLMQDSGADAMTIHCRTRAQMYSGKADWSALKDLKKEITVPVFANGDIDSVQAAKDCLAQSAVDGLAVARGVLGQPDLIYRIEHYLQTGEILEELTLHQKIELLKIHIQDEIALRGEHCAMQFVRKFYPYYIKGIREAAHYRGALVTETDYDKVTDILDKILEEQ